MEKSNASALVAGRSEASRGSALGEGRRWPVCCGAAEMQPCNASTNQVERWRQVYSDASCNLNGITHTEEARYNGAAHLENIAAICQSQRRNRRDRDQRRVQLQSVRAQRS